MFERQEAAVRKQEAMKESMERWKEERDRNADYIAQLKRNKEERKKEIEAQEALMQQMKEEEEAAEAAAEELKEAEEKDGKMEAVKKTETAEPAKQNFADQKKFKGKDDQGYEEALKAVVKPFDIATMDSEQLKKKVEELYDVFTNLINDKINLNKRMVEQDGEFKILREKLNEILDARAAKKGVIDMHKFYPGQKKTHHPPKMQIFSKYDNRYGS